MYYDRNSTTSPLSGELTWYYSQGNNRFRTKMRGGSGNGSSSDECESNNGPLPAGYYGRSDGDPDSRFDFVWKDWGNTVVRGWVWSLGGKMCRGVAPKLRFGLFIHSQGYSGWSSTNYSSEGCIKIDQGDRSAMALKYQNAIYDPGNSRLSVYG